MIRWRMDIVSQGMRLRQLGLSYGSIAVVLREYHGIAEATEARVRYALRSHGGAPPVHNRTAGLVMGRRADL